MINKKRRFEDDSAFLHLDQKTLQNDFKRFFVFPGMKESSIRWNDAQCVYCTHFCKDPRLKIFTERYAGGMIEEEGFILN